MLRSFQEKRNLMDASRRSTNVLTDNTFFQKRVIDRKERFPKNRYTSSGEHLTSDFTILFSTPKDVKGTNWFFLPLGTVVAARAINTFIFDCMCTCRDKEANMAEDP